MNVLHVGPVVLHHGLCVRRCLGEYDCAESIVLCVAGVGYWEMGIGGCTEYVDGIAVACVVVVEHLDLAFLGMRR